MEPQEVEEETEESVNSTVQQLQQPDIDASPTTRDGETQVLEARNNEHLHNKHRISIRFECSKNGSHNLGPNGILSGALATIAKEYLISNICATHKELDQMEMLTTTEIEDKPDALNNVTIRYDQQITQYRIMTTMILDIIVSETKTMEQIKSSKATRQFLQQHRAFLGLDKYGGKETQDIGYFLDTHPGLTH